MLLKLCGCLGGRGDDDNNNNSNEKHQPQASETGCLMCCCCPCLFRCRHRTSAQETSDNEMGTLASTPVISLTPPLNKYGVEIKGRISTYCAPRRNCFKTRLSHVTR